MKKVFSNYTWLLLLSVLTACKVSKDIPAQAAVPGQFRNAAAADTGSIAAIPWKNFFTDASLQQLIDSAIVKNYDMQIAEKNIESAQLLLKQAKWGYVPDVSLAASANTSRPSDNSLNGISLSQFLGKKHIEDYTIGGNLSWEADIWGKVRNQKRKARAAYLQSREAKDALQTNIVANVSQGYYNLLMLDAQLAVAQENLALNDSTVRIMHLQFTAGEVTSLAVQQAEAQRLVAAQLVPQLQQNITLQENALSILTGTMPGRIERDASLAQLSVPEKLSAGIPATMLSHRPDIKIYEAAVSIANANVGLTKAAMYPSLSITAAGGLNSFKASNWFNMPASLFGTVAGSLAAPVLQRRQLRTQYQLAKTDREKAVIQFRQAVLVAVGEVSDALVKLEQLKEQEAIVATRVQTLQSAIGNANLLFKNGMANYLEVITAQGNTLQSELELASIKRQQLSAVTDLYRSLGGGWQ
ncbi:efflux transporter outer membrane subunit [Chitinophagaceae bacterium MMS25-I14]